MPIGSILITPFPGGESKLTTAALLRHDAVQGGLKLGAGEDDATGVTHKTFDTFASDWSGCTNVAFDKVSCPWLRAPASCYILCLSLCVM